MSRPQRAQRARKEAEKAKRARAIRRNRILRNSALAVALGSLAVFAFFAFGGTGPTLTGDTGATTWDLPRLDDPGQRVALADFEGKPTIAVFFSSWCEVCEHEVPEFVAVSDRLGDQVNWVGINTQDNGAGGADAARWGIESRWPLARDIGGTTGNGLSTATFGLRGMPLTVIYDKTGEVVHVQRGGISGELLLSLLDQAFGIS